MQHRGRFHKKFHNIEFYILFMRSGIGLNN